MTEKEIIREAIRLLREEGWGQGAYRTPRGYCLLGSVYRAGGALLGSGMWPDAASPNIYACGNVVDAVQYVLARQDGMVDVATWNDWPYRTADEVIGLLEETLKSMDIGVEEETVVIEPLVEPVPEAEPVVAPDPVEVPVEAPELVPA